MAQVLRACTSAGVFTLRLEKEACWKHPSERKMKGILEADLERQIMADLAITH